MQQSKNLEQNMRATPEKVCPSVTISASPCQVIECMVFVLQHWVRKDDGHHICVWFFLVNKNQAHFFRIDEVVLHSIYNLKMSLDMV
jgi:hypothetical protein